MHGIRSVWLLVLLAVALSGGAAAARDIFVAPEVRETGDGSAVRPYATLEQAFASGRIEGGDRLILAGGEYGGLTLKNLRFAKPVEITAAQGATAHFDQILIAASSGLILRGLSVWPSRPEPGPTAVVQTLSNASDIVFDRLDVRSTRDAAGYMSWSRGEWLAVKRGGAFLRGERNTISNSRFTGFYMGIVTTGPDSWIIGNRVSGFSGDGMRALGDGSLVEGNLVQDCFQINANHADGFQSWSRGRNGRAGGGILRGLSLIGNRIIEWTGPPRHPLRCELQGIGLFGGMYQDLTIQNNIVAVRAWHGIAVYGALDTMIVNNTVVNAAGPNRKRPWIGVFDHKNGTPSQRVVVANNVAMAFVLPADLAHDRRMRNLDIFLPPRHLRAPYEGDFRPLPRGGLVDAGEMRFAPPRDIEGVRRPQGRAPDLGAYELH